MNSVGPLFSPSLETWPSPADIAALAGTAAQGVVRAAAIPPPPHARSAGATRLPRAHRAIP
jgi:hypothetical protein